MLRRYLARRKMRWAVRRVARMTPSLRRYAESSRQVRRTSRIAERALIPHGPIRIGFDMRTPAERKRADRIERFYHEALDRLEGR